MVREMSGLSEGVRAGALEREPVAIIGVSCRFPGGAATPELFWELLRNGVDAVGMIPEGRWSRQRFYDPNPNRPGKAYVHQGAFLQQPLDLFDADFFGILPREASRLDPQVRLLLEMVWEALEDAGQVPEKLAGTSVGVFIGTFAQDLAQLHISPENLHLLDRYSIRGLGPSNVAGRISYTFDFRGPCFALDTACSSSHVALHYACESILGGDCSLAVAGAVNVIFDPYNMVMLCKGGLLSPDGRCKTFDASANGYVRSEGGGVLVLKRLSQALADGDPLHALILSTGVAHDGQSKHGLGAPNEASQKAVMIRAYQKAGISPGEVQYVEAHGPGTAAGDPIEARALAEVLGAGRPPGTRCLVGSVKSNIGHLEPAAGIAGVIKAVLCLEHGQIPPNLHFNEPNPAIPFQEWGLEIPRKLMQWPAGPRPRVAGVSSFGFGGTVAHVVLQEAPSASEGRPPVNRRAHTLNLRSDRELAKQNQWPPIRPVLLPISARSQDALRAYVQAYIDLLSDGSRVVMEDVVYTASMRRSHHSHRLAALVNSHLDAKVKLEEFLEGRTPDGLVVGRTTPARQPKVAWIFTGMGPQRWGMGRELLEEEMVFRQAIERCDALFAKYVDWSLLKELTADELHSRMAATAVAQPANFALQVALAELWRSWGVEPDLIVGHSVGEVAAAYASGALTLEDAVRVSFHRSRLQSQLAGKGGMLAVGMTLEEAQELIKGRSARVSISAVNSATAVTLSGDTDALEEIAGVLEAAGILHRRLAVEVPYHSHHMDAILEELHDALRTIRPRIPVGRLHSTVTGLPVTNADLDARYWCRNARERVEFARAVEGLIGEGCDVFIEIGPHPTLAPSIVEGFRRAGRAGTVVASLMRGKPERATMLMTLGKLYTLGYPINWQAAAPEGRVAKLPPYPWQRRSHWTESSESIEKRTGAYVHPLLGSRLKAPSPCWETELTEGNLPYLAEHCVQGVVVLPGAAYIEAALAVDREMRGEGACRLEEIKFEEVLFVSENDLSIVHVSTEPATGLFAIYSRRVVDESPWTLHARGTRIPVRPAPTEFGHLPIQELQARLPEVEEAQEIYERLEERGLGYGPSFRGIVRQWTGADEALSEIRVPESLEGTVAQYRFHPAVLDACLHSLLAAAKVRAPESARLYLPVAIDRFIFRGEMDRQLWVHARLKGRTSNFIEGDLRIADRSGHVLAQVCRLRAQALGRDQSDKGEDLQVYEARWDEYAHEHRAPTRSSTGETWLVFGNSQSTCAAFLELLASREQAVVQVCPGEKYERINDRCYCVRPDSIEEIRELLKEVRSSRPPIKEIVYFSDFAMPTGTSGEAPANDAIEACVAVIALVKALFQSDLKEPPRLSLLTHHAICVPGQVNSPSPSQGAIWGLGRSLRAEQPELRGTIIDLDSKEPADQAQFVWDHLCGDSKEEEVVLRGGKAYVCRLVALDPGEALEPQKKRASAALGAAFRLERDEGDHQGMLGFREITRNRPGPREVEIRVRAVGISEPELRRSKGTGSDTQERNPIGTFQIGLQCSGYVTAAGDEVEEFAVGDAVVALAPGCAASYVTIPVEQVAHKPTSLTFEQAASLLPFMKAYYALARVARLRQGESILVHAALDSLDVAAVQMAKQIGADVFVMVDDAERGRYFRSLGIVHSMDARSLAFADEVMKRTGGEGVDVVLLPSCREAEFLKKSLQVVDAGGRVLCLDRYPFAAEVSLKCLGSNVTFSDVDLDVVLSRNPSDYGWLLRRVVRYFDRGLLRPVPCEALAASSIPESLQEAETSPPFGSVVAFGDEEVDVVPISGDALFREDGTYLITGGTSGFGLATAGWMVRHGARNVVLVGRRGTVTPEAQQAIAAVREAGAQAVVATADVTRADELARLISAISTTMPPLRGIVHAAANLGESHFAVQEELDAVRREMAPKLTGAWNLYALTRNLKLDFFLLYSSVASLFESPRVSAYAAANHFLDSLAHYCERQGQRAISVNWGAVGDVGVLARDEELRARVVEGGFRPLAAEKYLGLLGSILGAGRSQVALAAMNWDVYWKMVPHARNSPRFSAIAMKDEVARRSPIARVELTAAMRGVESGQEREAIVVRFLHELVAEVFETSTARIDPNLSLGDQGLDSLMSVELSLAIKERTGVVAPAVKLLQGPSVAELARYLLERLEG